MQKSIQTNQINDGIIGLDEMLTKGVSSDNHNTNRNTGGSNIGVGNNMKKEKIEKIEMVNELDDNLTKKNVGCSIKEEKAMVGAKPQKLEEHSLAVVNNKVPSTSNLQENRANPMAKPKPGANTNTLYNNSGVVRAELPKKDDGVEIIDKYKGDRRIYPDIDLNGWLKIPIKKDQKESLKKPKAMSSHVQGDLNAFLSEILNCNKVPELRSSTNKNNANNFNYNNMSGQNSKVYISKQAYDKNLLKNSKNPQFSNDNGKNKLLDKYASVEILEEEIENDNKNVQNQINLNRVKTPACNYAQRIKASSQTATSQIVENKNFGYKRNPKSPGRNTPKRLKKFSDLKANKHLDDETLKELDDMIEAKGLDFDSVPPVDNVKLEAAINPENQLQQQQPPNMSFNQKCLDKGKKTIKQECKEYLNSLAINEHQNNSANGESKPVINADGDDLLNENDISNIPQQQQNDSWISANPNDIGLLINNNNNDTKKTKKIRDVIKESKSLQVNPQATKLAEEGYRKNELFGNATMGDKKNVNMNKKYTSASIFQANWFLELTNEAQRTKSIIKSAKQSTAKKGLQNSTFVVDNTGKVSIGKIANSDKEIGPNDFLEKLSNKKSPGSACKSVNKSLLNLTTNCNAGNKTLFDYFGANDGKSSQTKVNQQTDNKLATNDHDNNKKPRSKKSGLSLNV